MGGLPTECGEEKSGDPPEALEEPTRPAEQLWPKAKAGLGRERVAHRGVGLDGPLDDVTYTVLHAVLHLPQPVLHIAGREDRGGQAHLLTLCRVHMRDLQVILEQQLRVVQKWVFTPIGHKSYHLC